MNNPKVSVIIPVYNVENYLRQCLDSVIGQSLEEIEIICVDDASRDGSLEILHEYAQKDKRIIVLSQENGGAGAARNNGLSIAKGKYLSFLDSDDFFESDMLEKAYDHAETLNADFVVFRSDKYFTEEKKFAKMEWSLRMDDLPPYQPFSHRQMTQNVFKVFVGWAWDKLYRKEFIDKHQLQFQVQRTSNDMLFVFSALVLAKRIGVLPDILAHQRRDAKDSLSKTRENSWHCFYNALSAVKQRLIQESIYVEFERDFVNYALHACLWNYETLAEPTKTLLRDKLIKEWFKELGIQDKDANYFYLNNEYKKYLEMIK